MFDARNEAFTWQIFIVQSDCMSQAADLHPIIRQWLRLMSQLGEMLVRCQVVPITRNKKKLDEYSMVLYNNVLSLPLLIVAAGINGEFTTLMQVPIGHTLHANYAHLPHLQNQVCNTCLTSRTQCAHLVSSHVQ